jgi:hypothetical protein
MSNVNPGQYKVAGRERQGEDVLVALEKAKLTQQRARLRRAAPEGPEISEEKMPEKETLERAEKDAEEGKSPSTQAGEFVREEIHHVREGKHGARSTKQAIAIGLSKARRAGVRLRAPKVGTTSRATRRQAARDSARGRRSGGPVSRTRSRAVSKALRREGRSSASRKALARQGRSSARRRSASERSSAARRAAATRRSRAR